MGQIVNIQGYQGLRLRSKDVNQQASELVIYMNTDGGFNFFTYHQGRIITFISSISSRQELFSSMSAINRLIKLIWAGSILLT
ncbi:hypothetical protein [Catalinimonas alkaloidigena]|uniref:hypothetical protein n=1 Tax=Catalinimonas alkaloidigena TaxID=1075417 RepID=UPI002405A39A|nr:hypothetical protein [Catalinimonas alkaloidigena]